MQLARVDGNIVAAVNHPSMNGWRVLICQPIDDAGRETGGPILAIDTLGAGLHSKVIFTTDGSFTRSAVEDAHSPLRNMVMSIVDEPAGQGKPEEKIAV